MDAGSLRRLAGILQAGRQTAALQPRHRAAPLHVGGRRAVFVQRGRTGTAIQRQQVDGGKAAALLTAQRQRRVEGFQRRGGPDARLEELSQQPHRHGAFGVSLRAAAHAVGQQHIQHGTGGEHRQLVAASALALFGPQQRAHAAPQQRTLRLRSGLAAQHLAQMLILGLCQRPGVLQPGPVLPPQTERVQLRIDGAQQLRKVQAPAGEKQGKILRFRPATLQHGGTGVVEGVVGGVVLRLPAALYQHAIAAGLLGGVVEDHRRVFAPLCGAGAEHGVIQVAKGRRPLSGGGFCRHGRHSLRQRRRIRQDASCHGGST